MICALVEDAGTERTYVIGPATVLLKVGVELGDETTFTVSGCTAVIMLATLAAGM